MFKVLLLILALVVILSAVNHYVSKFRYTDLNDFRIVEDENGFHIQYAEWLYGTKHYVNDLDSDGNVYSLHSKQAAINYWQDFITEE